MRAGQRAGDDQSGRQCCACTASSACKMVETHESTQRPCVRVSGVGPVSTQKNTPPAAPCPVAAGYCSCFWPACTCVYVSGCHLEIICPHKHWNACHEADKVLHEHQLEEGHVLLRQCVEKVPPHKVEPHAARSRHHPAHACRAVADARCCCEVGAPHTVAGPDSMLCAVCSVFRSGRRKMHPCLGLTHAPPFLAP